MIFDQNGSRAYATSSNMARSSCDKYYIQFYVVIRITKKNDDIDNALKKGKVTVQRFKGLGEMNPEELWQTTLNPDNRTMLRVQYSKGTKDKSKDDQKMIKILMGDDVAPRKEFITNNALNVANLDI